MRSKFLPIVPTLISFILSFVAHQSKSQVTLTSSPYVQDFNSLATLPIGWTVRTGASGSSLGNLATFTSASTSWSTTTGNFRNVASATGLSATSDATSQSGSTNRALAVRQTGGLGDPGAAFVLELSNTTGLSNFSLSFKLQSLDGPATAGRTTTWRVDYGFGLTPTSFTPATTVPATLSTTLSSIGWGSTDVTVNFGTALDNNADAVWIRIVALTNTSGSGSRPTTGIDDFQLSFTLGDATAPLFTSTYPKVSGLTTSGFDLITSLNEAGKTYFVIVPDGATSPTSAQVKAGQDANGTTVASGFAANINVSASATEYSTTLSSLNQDTEYDVYLVAEDVVLNLQSAPVKLDARTNSTSDTGAPVFASGYPTASLITPTGFTLKTTMNETGKTYFVILPSTSLTPTSTQVKAGQDASGLVVASGFSGTLNMNIANTEFITTIAGLSAATPYHIFVVAEDNIPNVQPAPIKISVTTLPLFFESFFACDGTASFTSFSVTGNQVWGCTDFGYNGSKGIRINGFSGSAIANEDWLISPVLQLSAGANLSFYSQFSFAGNGLQLKISSDYTGTGNPAIASWTDLNGDFPTTSVNSNSTALSDWKLSTIDLSTYASQKIYLAFVYTSTNSAAARWTLDEIKVNGALASYMAVSPSALLFNVAGESKSYTVKGYNLLNEVTVSAPVGFSISKDNTTYGNTVTLTPAEANTSTTVYARLNTPGPGITTLSGFIEHSSVGVASEGVVVSGVDKTKTFDIVTFNAEFFGTDIKDSGGAEFGPLDDALQIANAKVVLQTLAADVIALQEVSDDAALDQLVAGLNGYAKAMSPRWSYSFDAPDPNFPPQKIGFIYNTSTVQVVSSRVMFSEMFDAIRAGTVALPDYPGGNSSSFWSSGRLPFMATVDVTVNAVKKRIKLIVIHAKSGSAQADYDRRKYDVKVLYDSLIAHYPADPIILLGDLNDDVDTSIKAGAESTYKVFVDDAERFKALTFTLSQSGASSFPSSASFLDHLIISNELVSDYVANSAVIEDPRNYITNYSNTTSDHLPVSSRFDLTKLNQTISFAPLADKTFGDAAFTVNATATSGLSVSFSTMSDKISVTGSQVTIVKAGRAVIKANQFGNESYNQAALVEQSFCISPAKPVITASNVNTESPVLSSSASEGNQWYLNDALISGAVNSSYTASIAGNYKVKVKADDCVSAFSNGIDLIITGDIDTMNAKVIAFPNPAENTIMIAGLESDLKECIVIDLLGRPSRLKLEKRPEGHIGDVSNYLSGIYIINVHDGDAYRQIKFVKK